uniref:restriction endonuclease subunit S n=1 Tax=Candidatus Stercorousia sp. TaxID=3048886 RepID=UPI004027DF86
MKLKHCKIGDVVDLQQGLCINKKTEHLLAQNGIPLLRITDLINGTKGKFINKELVSSKFVANKNDIIYTRTGQVGLVFKNKYGVIHNNCFKVFSKICEVENNYIYWFLRQNKIYEYVNNVAAGAAQPDLNHDAFKSIDFIYPSKEIQQKIVKTLSNYDDLIENNNRRIKILEEMAQKIYKEWFVDFKFPGHETTTFKDSPLGKIPNDWEVKPIEKLLIHQIGGGWGNEIKTDKYNTPAYVIRGADIPNGRQGCIENCPLRYHTSSNLKTRTLNENDIVFEVSGGSKGQPVGRTLILNKNLFNQFKNNVICASFCKLLRVDQTQIIPEYIYLHLLNIYNNGEIEKYQTQSTGINIFKFNFFLDNEKVLFPEQNII